MRFDVVRYDPTWPQTFDRMRSDLAEALRNASVVGIEHVGSTAVPGLAAKPVIDIDVVVRKADLNAAIHALEAAGYHHEGDLGIPERHALRAPDEVPRRHVYVVVEGSLALRNHLGVRDVLRSNSELRARYGALKLRLSERDFDSVDGYAAAKSELLQEILEEAGIGLDERLAIRESNR